MAPRSWLFTALTVVAATVPARATLPPPCPGAASVLVVARNLSPDSRLDITVDGELLSPQASCDGPGSITYAATLSCTGGGVVPCARITGLRPGAWANRLAVTVAGSAPQLQARRAVFVAGTPGTASNTLAWTIYPRAFVVTAATETDLRAQLQAAADFTAGNPGPALVTFSRDGFPGAGFPRVITLAGRTCDLDGGHCAAIRLTASRLIVDALDPRGEPGAVFLSVGVQKHSLLRILGSDNVFRGLVLEGTRTPAPLSQYDTVAMSGPDAHGNRLEQSIVRGPTMGDATSADGGAGTPAADGTGVNVIDRCEVSGARDKGLKVTTGAHVEIRRSCVHDNANGGVQSTLGGHVVAIQNVVQHNVPGGAQNGLSAGETAEEASTLDTDGNIVRFAGARGLSVADNARATFTNDYVSDNQFAGSRVETKAPNVVPHASFHGVALVCNNNAGITGVCRPRMGTDDTNCLTNADCCGGPRGCCESEPGCTTFPVCILNTASDGIGAVQAKDCGCPDPTQTQECTCTAPVPSECADCLGPEVSYGDALAPGANAFTLNRNLAPGSMGVNFNQALPDTGVSAQGNQWEHCGSGGTCDAAAVMGADIRLAPRASVQLGTPPLPGPASGAPLARALSEVRPAAGDLVRVFGSGFNAIGGAACASGSAPVDPCGVDNPALADRNRCPGPGNCVQFAMGGRTVAVDVATVTPTMLAFRMPFDCTAPATVTVSRLGADGAPVSSTIGFCDPSGCLGEPATTPCDDGDDCTVGDHCSGNGPTCIAGTPRLCGGPCVAGTCNAQGSCLPAAPTAACDDGDACTVGDHCRGDADVCLGGPPRTCAGVCRTGACDSRTGCVPAPESTTCDDGDPCTTGDHCDGVGACARGVAAACDDGDACTADGCTDGVCTHRALVAYDAITCRTVTLEGEVTGTTQGAHQVRSLLARITADVDAAREADGQGARKRARHRLTRAAAKTQRLLVRLHRLALPVAEKQRLRDLARAVRDAIRAQLATLR